MKIVDEALSFGTSQPASSRRNDVTGEERASV
jgi:hypothetical protein